MPDLYLIVLVYRNTSLNLLESMRSVDTAIAVSTLRIIEILE